MSASKRSRRWQTLALMVLIEPSIDLLPVSNEISLFPHHHSGGLEFSTALVSKTSQPAWISIRSSDCIGVAKLMVTNLNGWLNRSFDRVLNACYVRLANNATCNQG